MNENVFSIYEFDGYLLNGIHRSLFYRGVEVHLTKRNFDVLQLLIENNGRVVNKAKFFETVWADTFVEDGNLAVSITALRKIFESHSNQSFIETIPRHGYKFTADVRKIYEDEDESKLTALPEDQPAQTAPFENEPTGTADESLKPVEAADELPAKKVETALESAPKVSKAARAPRFSERRHIRLIGGLSVGAFLVIMSIGAFFYYYYDNEKSVVQKSAETNPALKKIVIFPFENITQIKETDYLSLAFADSLNYSLFSFPNISVTSTSQIKKYFNQSYDPIEEGRKLGVSVIITGSYHKTVDKLVVNVAVTDISLKNPIIQQEKFIKTTNDLTDLQGNVVKFIISRLNLNTSEKDLASLKKRETQNLQAYELYLRASNYYANDKPDDAINYYQQSLAADPDFEIASEGLASVYMTQGNAYGCGEPCSNKALEILGKLQEKDPDNDRVSINLAQSLVELNQTEKAVPILMGILEKNPKNYFAYNGLNYAYRYAGLLEESDLMYQKGKEDVNYTVLTDKGYWFYDNARLYQGDYTGFIASLKDDDDSFISLFYQGLSYFYLKDNEKAKNLFNQSFQREPDAMITQLGKVYSYFIDNDKIRGLEILNKIYQSIKVNKVYDGEMIYKTAQAYSVYNQKPQALELFDLSVEKGFFCYPYFASDALMKNIRNEPEFQIILDKSRKRHEAFKQSR